MSGGRQWFLNRLSKQANIANLVALAGLDRRFKNSFCLIDVQITMLNKSIVSIPAVSLCGRRDLCIGRPGSDDSLQQVDPPSDEAGPQIYSWTAGDGAPWM